MNRIKDMISNALSNMQFIPAKPKVIARIINNYYRIVVLKKPCLRAITLALNYDCQLSCQYCYAQESRNKQDSNEKLSLSQISTILDDAAKCGAINIHLSGGEPLLCKDFYKIVSLVDTDRNILSLVTNGLLLSQESERLKKAKLDLIIVSIDSPYSDVHDKLRGYEGAYEKSWDGIDAALGVGLKVMVAMVATSQNLHNGEIAKQIELCRKKKIMLQILPLRPAGQESGQKKILLSQKDRLQFFKFTSYPDVRWDGQSSYLSPRCLAARERLYINPSGNVFACDFIRKSFGNVKNESLIDVWHRMLSIYPFNKEKAVCLSAFDEEFINNFKY